MKITPEAYYARQHNIVSEQIRDKHIFVIGCGAGSELVLRLARAGIGRFTLIDPDTVAVENLCRSAFTAGDIGRPKVEALARLIKKANPFVKVYPVQGDVTAGYDGRLASLAHGFDLILAQTDSFAAHAWANLLSIVTLVPAIYTGLHAGAAGGIIHWVIPGETPCYRCLAKTRYAPGTTTNLDGAAGSLIDIAIGDAVAGKVALALLERSESSAMGQFFADMGGKNTIIVRTTWRYRWDDAVDPFAVVLADLPEEPKPYAKELADVLFGVCTIAWRGEFNPDCPDCGGLQASAHEQEKRAGEERS